VCDLAAKTASLEDMIGQQNVPYRGERAPLAARGRGRGLHFLKAGRLGTLIPIGERTSVAPLPAATTQTHWVREDTTGRALPHGQQCCNSF